MKISDILTDAIEELCDGQTAEFHQYSCNAIQDVCCLAKDYVAALKFLRSLGCNTDSAYEFYEFETLHGSPTPESQMARAIWLTFAAMIAKEERL